MDTIGGSTRTQDDTETTGTPTNCSAICGSLGTARRGRGVQEILGTVITSRQQARGKQKAPNLTMSVLMQSRASFSNGKAVGVDGISSEILKALPWRGLQKIKNAFVQRYRGKSKR